ncbi:MAG: DCC1-like thiol-disulfide oxidoreductase family protein [Candidatus Dadabacteria bacterium]|nr:DCC1-like thiol-disulfide oxidoreductase family protein [Candidatus Dadabacteria bacterium]
MKPSYGSLHKQERQIPGSEKPVIFFDGVCGGCNMFVNFVMWADARAEIFFSPVQGETAVRFSLCQEEPSRDWKIAYADEEGVYEGADAVLLVLKRLGGLWKVPALLIHIPLTVKDYFYGIMSRNRYRLFGKREICRIPSAAERERFLP